MEALAVFFVIFGAATGLAQYLFCKIRIKMKFHPSYTL
jgi:hypothetical protein